MIRPPHARAAVGRDTNAVYRILLRTISAERVAQIVPRQIRQSFNLDEVECQVVHEGHVTGQPRDITRALLPWLSILAEEYVAYVITRSGGKSRPVGIRRDGPEPTRAAQETSARVALAELAMHPSE